MSFASGGNATTLRNEFPAMRDLLLGGHIWYFASDLVSLTPLSGVSLGSWKFAFQKPTDCARIISITTKDMVYPYEMRADKLYSNMSVMDMRYVKSFPSDAALDGVLYPNDFAQALTCKIAAHIGVSVTQNRALTDLSARDYFEAIREARFNGACERYDQVLGAEDWLDSRYESSGYDDVGSRHTAT